MSTTALPRTLGKYRPIALVARGGMGNAYLALVNGAGNFNKLVVIKVLKPEFAEDQDFLAMFRDEARIAANLNHPNVVQTHELGVQDGHFFIAMDFVDGQPLRIVRKRLQENGALSLGAHLRIVCDVLEGLHYAHELTDHDGSPLHLVHRDVSPHNVMVSYDGHAKLLDFGIAKARGSSHQTSTGVLKGKVGYMAPEQARCEALDRRADLFPVGVLVWEAIVGGRMWGALNDVQVLAQLVRREIPELPEVVDGRPVPPALRAIVARATAADPDQRYPTARAFADELEAFLDTLPRAETSARAIAELLTAHFGSERDKRRRVVDDAIRQVSAAQSTAEYPAMLGLTSTGALAQLPGHGTSPGTPLAILQSSSGTPSQPSFGSFGSPHESSPGTLTPSGSASFVSPMLQGGQGTYSGSNPGPTFAPSTLTPPPASGSAWKVGVAAVVAVAVVALAGVFVFRPKDDGVAAKPSGSSEVPGTATVRLEVVVSSGTEKATAFLDGREISVGDEVRAPRDEAPHTLKVRAAGFKDPVETVKLDKDQRVTITLEADGAHVAAAATPSHTPPPTSTFKPLAHGAKPATPPPPVAAQPAPSTPPQPPPQPPPASTPKRPDRPIIEVLK